MNELVHVCSQSIENFVQLIYKWTKLIFRPEHILPSIETAAVAQALVCSLQYCDCSII